MMFAQSGPVKVFVATRPVDFRKGIDGLALAVQEMFGLDPFCGAIFVFRAKRADRIKLLIWDQTGMVLVQKRLEGGKFVWPQVRDGVMRMSPAQLAALFEDEYPSCARAFWHPEPVSLDQRIGGFKELSHDCDDGDFGGFPGLAERGVFSLEVGVETHGNQGWHVEGIAQRFAPAAE